MKPESSEIPPPPPLGEWLAVRTDAERRALEDAWERAGQGANEWTHADSRRKAEVWSAVQQQMDRANREELPRPRLRLVQAHTLRWVAAAATVALLVGVGYFFRTVTIEAPRGDFAEVTLPDGSQVQLNSESTLSYRANFVGTRRVRLEGEAFFEVTTSNDGFDVETFNAQTTVLGTSFNVRARRDEEQANTSVAVASGSVRVSAKGAKSGGVVLRAGQQSRVNAQASVPTTPMPVTLERRLAWRTGGLAFSDQPFALIFAEIERRYDVEIDSSDDILSKSFSFYVNAPVSAESVLSDLARAEGFRYRATSTGYEVYHP